MQQQSVKAILYKFECRGTWLKRDCQSIPTITLSVALIQSNFLSYIHYSQLCKTQVIRRLFQLAQISIPAWRLRVLGPEDVSQRHACHQIPSARLATSTFHIDPAWHKPCNSGSSNFALASFPVRSLLWSVDSWLTYGSSPAVCPLLSSFLLTYKRPKFLRLASYFGVVFASFLLKFPCWLKLVDGLCVWGVTLLKFLLVEAIPHH